MFNDGTSSLITCGNNPILELFSKIIPYLVYQKKMKKAIDNFKNQVYTTKQIGNVRKFEPNLRRLKGEQHYGKHL